MCLSFESHPNKPASLKATGRVKIDIGSFIVLSHRAGQKAQQKDLYNIPQLLTHFYQYHPNPSDKEHQVKFGTSGHRGCADNFTFNEDHILAITQAIADVRAQQGFQGPVFLGKDTHALSEPAFCAVIEVLVGNGVEIIIQEQGGYTPTPAISCAILNYNQNHTEKSDGIILTPSHNPPQDGGIKYNPPHGGPAEEALTQCIEERANAYLAAHLKGVRRVQWMKAKESSLLIERDLLRPYVLDLENVIDMKAIKKADLRLAADPLGGSGIEYWKEIANHFDLNITLVNENIDPSFRFMFLDKDGKIRMDCSSPSAMTGLLAYKDQYDLAFGNDPDFDRHGIVTSAGLMNPNDFLAVCIDYLYQHRPLWRKDLAVGKSVVSSGMIDKVVKRLGLSLCEVPVGFKWFVEGLYQGKLGFGAEESAGATFLRKSGETWSTDKDGILLCLLAAEIMAVTGKNPQVYFNDLVKELGLPYYSRIQAPANTQQKALLSALCSETLTAQTLAGDPIVSTLTHAPGNNQAIGGLKVTTKSGWFAARPSGTEDAYKIYCESFISQAHLALIQEEAQAMVSRLFKNAGLDNDENLDNKDE